MIVKKLENLLKAEYGKCEIVDGTWMSGDDTYHLRRITAANNNEDALLIARNIPNAMYMAQFTCNEGNLDIFFAFATKQRQTIRWRYYYEDGNYTQGCLEDWFLVEKTTKTMTTLIDGTGVREDGHEGHYFHSIVNVE